MLYGVDVHDGYQAGLSFPTLARQGYTFAVVKLTQGTGYARDLGDDWVRAARTAGLIPGGYHWLTRADGAAQARWFHAKVQESGGPAGMLIQLDCEDNATWADVQAWDAEWTRLTGGHPYLLYTGAWWWGAPGRGWPGASVTPLLWHSHYLTADADTVPDDPAAFASRIPASWWTPGYGGWPSATILQFTSKGDAGSLGNNVDLNVYRGTREQLLTLTQPKGTTTVGEFLKLTDGPVPDGVYYSDYTGCRWIGTPDDITALIARGAAAPFKDLGVFTVEQAAPTFGEPIVPWSEYKALLARVEALEKRSTPRPAADLIPHTHDLPGATGAVTAG